MERLRKTTLKGQESNFGCAQYVPPGVEVLGQTPIVGSGKLVRKAKKKKAARKK
jgi:hypothetical protein